MKRKEVVGLSVCLGLAGCDEHMLASERPAGQLEVQEVPRYRITKRDQSELTKLIEEQVRGAAILEVEVMRGKAKGDPDREFVVTLKQGVKHVLVRVDTAANTVTKPIEIDRKALRLPAADIAAAEALVREKLGDIESLKIDIDDLRFDVVPAGIWRRDDRRETNQVLSVFLRNKDGAYLHTPAVKVDLTEKQVLIGGKL